MSRKLIKEEHFRNLSKFCSSNQNNDDLHEYFQFLLNKNEENLDKDFFKKHKKCINDLNSNEIRKENENVFTITAKEGKKLANLQIKEFNSFQERNGDNKNEKFL